MRFLVLALLAASCPPTPPGPPAPQDASALGDVLSAPEAAPVPTDAAAPPADACSMAQDNLLRLGCKDARGRLLGGPTLHDAGFADVCRDTLVHGVDVHAECLARAQSCQGVTACSL